MHEEWPCQALPPAAEQAGNAVLEELRVGLRLQLPESTLPSAQEQGPLGNALT